MTETTIPTTGELYENSASIAFKFVTSFKYPWEALDKIGNQILKIAEELPSEKFNKYDGAVWIAKNATVARTALISGPCIIDEGTEIRHCALIRGNVIIGKGSVVGNSTELKNCILFDGVQVPHYNYVGDSILGYKSHLGAGAITSNVKSDKSFVAIKSSDFCIETRLKKCGSFLGDFVEIGCGSVLNPGTIIGKRTSVYPLSSVRGVIGENCIYKSNCNIVERK